MKRPVPLQRASSQDSNPSDVAQRQSSVRPVCHGDTEDALVAEAVIRIREILAHAMDRGMTELGEYLLETFYQGDPSLFRSSNPRKHASIRKLQARCGSMDLPISFSTLARALRIAVLLRELPDDSPFRHLPSSHQSELLRLQTAERIDLLAARACEDSYSVKRLRAAVQKAAPGPSSRRGRKRIPAVLKALRRCRACLVDERTGSSAFPPKELDALDEAHREQAHEAAETVWRQAAELARRLKRSR